MKYAIFDLDGTLLDSMPIWADLDKSVLEPLGIIANDDLNKRFKTMTLQQSSSYLTQTFALDMTADNLMQIFTETISFEYRENIPLKPGALEFLQHLHENGILSCVATASERNLAEAALQRTGALPHLQFILTCSELKTSKENPKIFLEAMKRMGGNLQQTVVFEDAYLSLLSAKKTGFPVICIHEETHSQKSCEEIRSHADGYVSSFHKLLR